jgi:hypothetical protein
MPAKAIIKEEPVPANPGPVRRTTEGKESARVYLTTEQLLEAGRELAASQSEVRQLEDDFKSVRDEWKSRISAVEARITTTAGRISRGYDIKPVVCEIVFDEPESGLKTCNRLDTGERLWVKEMTESDKQLTLDLEAKEAEEAAVRDAGDTEPAPVGVLVGVLGVLAANIEELSKESGIEPEMILNAMTAINAGADTVTKLQGALKIGYTAAKKLFAVCEKGGAPAPEADSQEEKEGASDEN